jgi:formylglycine-generating enzyme required for sulfatase activity
LLQHFFNENKIDWKQKIDWKDDRLLQMLLSPEERVSGRQEIDPAKISYSINFFGKEECISIYPDTLVWMRDFSYSYNEPLAKNYFSQSLFDQYPVAGINLKQAMAFCRWKSAQLNKMLNGKYADKVEVMVTLPSNAEWESAAFEEKDSDNIFTGNKSYTCNFGSITTLSGVMKKGFKDDGYFYTSPVKNYPSGPFGVYDMKGNVAEWTLTSREEIMNAEMKPEKINTSFVVKGGGWNSTPFYLQAGACQFFSADAAHSFVGFRYLVEIKNRQ